MDKNVLHSKAKTKDPQYFSPSSVCILKTNLRIPVENEHGLWRRKQISPQLNHSLQIWETSLFCEKATHSMAGLLQYLENGQNKIHRLYSSAFGASSVSAGTSPC